MEIVFLATAAVYFILTGINILNINDHFILHRNIQIQEREKY